MVMQTILDEGLAGWVVRHKRHALVYDTLDDERWQTFPDDPNSPRSVLCMPLIHNDQVLAVLTLGHPETYHFNERHEELVAIIANQAAVAIRNAQLFHETQTQQQQLEMILQALPEILLVVDHQGRILRINNGVQHLLGGDDPLDQQAIIGHRLEEFTSEEQPGHLLAPIQRYIQKPPPTSSPWSFEARDEEHSRDYQVVLSTWSSISSGPGGYLLVMHDVTTLRDLHRFKDEMLRVVSHDLRSPVALISSAREMLEHDLADTESESLVPKYLQIISQSIERMEGLLDDLLRAESSTRELIDPELLVRKVVEQIRPLAEQKHQSLSLRIELDLAANLVGDPMLLSEAVENYLTNAVKYTGAGGHIQVEASIQDGRLHYVVEDDGPGIAAKHLPHLFEAYYRLPDVPQKGYGIGLNLVKTIVERHGGQVWVESKEQVGSRFGFWLPLNE